MTKLIYLLRNNMGLLRPNHHAGALGMLSLLSMCLLSFSISSCNKDEVPDSDNSEDEIEEITPVKPLMRTIHVGASSGDSDTKTSLSGNLVLWNENDVFKIIKEGPLDNPSVTLRVTLDQPSSGLAFWNVSGTSIYIKYDDINVKLGGNDITSSIVNSSSSSNSYIIGKETPKSSV